MSMLRITLRRALAATTAGLLLLPLAACSGEDEVARDQPAPTGTASSDQDVEAEEPTSGPDVGFGPTDYAFTLQVSCFCPYAAVPVRVTVEDDRVVEAVFEKGGGRGGAKAGDPAPEFFELTIDDVIAEVTAAAERAAALGVRRDGILIDPTHDFGKNTYHGLSLLRHVKELVNTGWPVLMALSNKDFVGETLGVGLTERLEGTLAATAIAAAEGAAMFRVHEVGPTRRVLEMVASIKGARQPKRTVRGLA